MLVDLELGRHSADQLLVGDGVAQALLGHGCAQHPQELVVAADSGQVAQVLGRPVLGQVGGHAGPLVLEVAGPHHLQGVEPVERDAPGGQLLQARVGVEHRLGEVHLHAAEVVDHVGERVEVEDDVVLDRDAQVLVDGRHQLARPLVEGGVDLVGPRGPGVGDEEVARHRQDRHRVPRWIQVKEHDHVAVDTVDALRAQPVRSVLHGQGAAVGRADHEDVLGAGVGPAGRDVGQPAHVDAVDLVIEVPGIAQGGAHQDDDDHGEGPDDPLGLAVSALRPTTCRFHLLAEDSQPRLVERAHGCPAGRVGVTPLGWLQCGQTAGRSGPTPVAGRNVPVSGAGAPVRRVHPPIRRVPFAADRRPGGRRARRAGTGRVGPAEPRIGSRDGGGRGLGTAWAATSHGSQR